MGRLGPGGTMHFMGVLCHGDIAGEYLVVEVEGDDVAALGLAVDVYQELFGVGVYLGEDVSALPGPDFDAEVFGFVEGDSESPVGAFGLEGPVVLQGVSVAEGLFLGGGALLVDSGVEPF